MAAAAGQIGYCFVLLPAGCMLLQSKVVKQKDIAPEIEALKQAQKILAGIAQQTEAEAQQQAVGQTLTNVVQARRSPGVADAAARVAQAASGGVAPVNMPQTGTGG
jgi:hypothetical protein